MGSDRSNLSFERVRHQRRDGLEAAAATLTRRTAIERALGLTELPRMPRRRRCRPHEIHIIPAFAVARCWDDKCALKRLGDYAPPNPTAAKRIGND